MRPFRLLLALLSLGAFAEEADIPWRAELRKAVAEAERDRKPLLIWAMNGHPLGST